MVIELESVKTRISAPAHPSATGIGRVSGLVNNKTTQDFADFWDLCGNFKAKIETEDEGI